MQKNMVIVKHLADNGKFLFYVPKGISLEVGDNVACDTIKGKNQIGVCCCDSFLGDPEVVCPLFGTSHSRMKYVTAKLIYRNFIEAIKDEVREEELEYDRPF